MFKNITYNIKRQYSDRKYWKKHVYCRVIILTANTYYLISKRFNFCKNIIFTWFNLLLQKLICRIPYRYYMCSLNVRRVCSGKTQRYPLKSISVHHLRTHNSEKIEYSNIVFCEDSKLGKRIIFKNYYIILSFSR